MFVEEEENRGWVGAFVERERRAGRDFAECFGLYRRVDGLAYAFHHDVISREQMSAGRRYENDYDALHRAGKYRCTIWRFIGEGISYDADRAMDAAMRLRRARRVLTVRERVLCDAVCGEDILSLDIGLPLAMEKLLRHYGADEEASASEDFRVFFPIILTESQKRAENIRRALMRLATPLKPAVVRRRGKPMPLPVTDSEEAPEDLSWDDFLPSKPARAEHHMEAGWLREQGVLKRRRDKRMLGVQAKSALKVKAKSSGVRRRTRGANAG